MKIVLLIVICGIGGTMTGLPKHLVDKERVPIKDAPFSVVVFQNTNPVCGGALISFAHVLTAAHCVMDASLRKYSDITVESATDVFHRGAIRHQAVDVICAPGYSSADLLNDIAIITLSSRVPFNIIPSIPLPRAEPKYDQSAEAIAFEYVTPFADCFLRKVNTVMRRAEWCAVLESFEYIDLSSKFCVIYEAAAQLFPNHGDGTPLVRKGEVVGIASAQSVTSRLVHYYTNVHKFVPFIKSVIGESSKEWPVNL